MAKVSEMKIPTTFKKPKESKMKTPTMPDKIDNNAVINLKWFIILFILLWEEPDLIDATIKLINNVADYFLIK
jgi:hypothetical protein